MVHECVSGQPTATSYTWNFRQEANTIFGDIQSDARQVVDHAATLQSFAYGDLSREAHAVQLMRVKAAVNDMGNKLCRLETIRRVTAPWQQKTIDQIAKTARLMADNTEDAIVFVNSHPEDLWSPTYGTYVNNLYKESRGVARTSANAEEYARTLHEYRGLRNELGLKASS